MHQRLVFASALLSLWSQPLPAAGQDVYYSQGSQIRKLTLPSVVPTTIFSNPNGFVGDLALCADGQLYFVDLSFGAIRRLDVANPTGSELVFESGVGVPKELRLSSNCDVLFATSSGVFEVNGAPPFSSTAVTLATTVAGSGLALAFDGSIRYSDSAAIVGLGVANGGDGSREALSVGAICRSSSNAITCTRKDQSALLHPTLATLGTDADHALYFEFFTDDTAVVATSVDQNTAIGGEGVDHNGILWLVGPSGVVSELTRAPLVATESGGTYDPIVGVAVSPGGSKPVTTSGTTHHVAFGPVTFDVTSAQSCSFNVTLTMLSAPDAQVKLTEAQDAQVNGPALQLDPANGGGGWIANVLDDATAGACGPAGSVKVTISQFIDNEPNRAVIDCDPSCRVVTVGNFPFAAPDDESDVTDQFPSDYLTAIIRDSATNRADHLLFLSPLNQAAVVHGAITAAEINAASLRHAHGGLPIKFRRCADQACTRFLPAEAPLPSGVGAGLSIARFDDQGHWLANCDVDDSGGANHDKPIFRVAGFMNIFNLSTPPLGPAVCQDPSSGGTLGLYGATVFSNGGLSPKTTILFKLQK